MTQPNLGQLGAGGPLRMIRAASAALALVAALVCSSPVFAAGGSLSNDEAAKMVAEMEARNAPSSYKVMAVVQETFEGRRIAREVLIYNDSSRERAAMLFTRPKNQAGSGVLRIERNVWFYDASVGKWTRQTERDRIGGTNLRSSDLTSPSWTTRYDTKDGGEELLDGQPMRKLILTAKRGEDVPFPKIIFWVDSDIFPIKREDYALSGRLLRTTRGDKMALHKKGEKPIFAPTRLVVQDAVDKGRVSQVDFKAWVPSRIEDSTFTKAWMETRSR